ncbi:MAG TPA: hypothetical protein VKF15_07070 [Nitrososphaerales archaeon]|nr:hypothetical protein [Nitrososphaerales archaeon]
MTAAERAVWEDGEGSFSFYGMRSVYMIRTSQAERGILEDYRDGAVLDGVPCSLNIEHRHQTQLFNYNITMYYTQISGITNVVRELLLTSPWRRHADKLKRIEELKKTLAAPDKQGERKMREAARALRAI